MIIISLLKKVGTRTNNLCRLVLNNSSSRLHIVNLKEIELLPLKAPCTWTWCISWTVTNRVNSEAEIERKKFEFW